jgi:hypothetical protein
MNSMNDDRFFDLAMKSIAGKATDSEKHELESWLNANSSSKTEFERLKAEARLAREALPLVEAMQAKGAELPGYARSRLQSKVKQTLGQKQASESDEEHRAFAWGWRWFLGLAATVAVLALVAWPLLFATPKPQIQVAMLDSAGITRGGDTNESLILAGVWKGPTVTNFSNAQDLKSWEKEWPTGARGYQVKVIYDRAAAEIRVVGRGLGREFTNSFPVDSDIREALTRVQAYINQQTGK